MSCHLWQRKLEFSSYVLHTPVLKGSIRSAYFLPSDNVWEAAEEVHIPHTSLMVKTKVITYVSGFFSPFTPMGIKHCILGTFQTICEQNHRQITWTYDFCIAWVDVLPLSSWASLVAIEAVWIVFRIRIQPEWFACRFLYYYILIFSTKLRKVLNIKFIIHIGVNGEQHNNLSTSYKSSPVWRGVNKLVFNLCLPVCTMEKIKDNGVNKKSTSNIIKKNICVFLQNRTIYGNLSSKRKFYYNNNKQEKEQLEKRLGFSEFKL